MDIDSPSHLHLQGTHARQLCARGRSLQCQSLPGAPHPAGMVPYTDISVSAPYADAFKSKGLIWMAVIISFGGGRR